MKTVILTALGIIAVGITAAVYLACSSPGSPQAPPPAPPASITL